MASSLPHNTPLAPGVLSGARSNLSAHNETGGAGRADVPVELHLVWGIFRDFGQWMAIKLPPKIVDTKIKGSS
jgi:hypothetical protein